MWLEWKYKDLTIPFAILGAISFVSFVMGSTDVLKELALVLCLLPAFFFNTLIIRSVRHFYKSHDFKYYAITNHHIFYKLPGKTNLVAVKLRDIKRYEVQKNDDGTATIKFRGKRKFQFDHISNAQKLAKMLDTLIKKSKDDYMKYNMPI